jgi:hypothetical protein
MSRSRIKLLPVTFIKTAPMIAITGRHARKAADKTVFRSIEGGIYLTSFPKQLMKASNKTIGVSVTISGMRESGWEISMIGPTVLIDKPANNRNAMLKPTEKRILLGQLELPSFRSLEIIMPGTKVRYKNPMTCLPTGILNKTTA